MQELILFSRADLERSIPSMVDGLKPGQRKILFACFKRNLRKEIKVRTARKCRELPGPGCNACIIGFQDMCCSRMHADSSWGSCINGFNDTGSRMFWQSSHQAHPYLWWVLSPNPPCIHATQPAMHIS